MRSSPVPEAGATRTHPHLALTQWLSERRCGDAWGDIIRPDGCGRWRDHDTELGFFAEIDLGTEPLDRLIRKVDAYTRLAHATGIHTPVLFHLPGARQREYTLHAFLGAPPIPVATTSSPSPLGPVWLSVAGDGNRRHLAELAHLAERPPHPTEEPRDGGTT